MEQDAFAARISQRQLVDKVFEMIEMIVDEVAAAFPDHGDVRLNIYELVADNLHGMVRVLRGDYPPILPIDKTE